MLHSRARLGFTVVEALLAVHPEYATAMLHGRKTVEIRRRVPSLRPGTRLWLYATRPCSRIVGCVTVEMMTRASVHELWERFHACVLVDQSTFYSYFSGLAHGIALSLSSPVEIDPIPLAELSKVRVDFHPPRVLTFLTASESVRLKSLRPSLPE